MTCEFCIVNVYCLPNRRKIILQPWMLVSLLLTRIYGDQTISSEGGTFILGFFKPGNSSNNYIGIWYNRISVKTIVWVANREKPVVDRSSAELRISNGNLVLFDESNIMLWSTNLLPRNSSSVEAVLLDEGNLVLRDGSNSDPLWQSFDNPTDTFLPGARIGINKITGTSARLTSWKNKNDPAPGLFSVELDPNGTSQFYILWNRNVMWSSGNWNGKIFSLIPEMRLNYIYNFSYYSNENESYFTYSLYNTSIVSRCVIDVGGQIQQMSWLAAAKQWNLFWAQPRRQSDIYGYCGAYASYTETSPPLLCHCLAGFRPKSLDEWNSGVYNAGCERKASLQCENSNGKNDRFLPSQSMQLPGKTTVIQVGNAQECESTCLNNCACTAYAYYNSTCSIWFGDLLNVQQIADYIPHGETLYIKLAASEFSSSNNIKKIVIGVVVGSIIIFIVLGLVLSIILRRKRATKMEKVSGTIYEINKSIAAEGKSNPHLVLFSFRSILTATNNFSEANKLGEGGFGPVYKGNEPGDKEIAIKRLSRKSGQGLEEFMNELKLIANLQHKYLIRLLGYCVEKEEKILIYEYMPNRSLDKFLFDPSEKGQLLWDKRFKIAEGVAQGLLYIHKFSRLKVIHRDLKASNILLDEAMNPKISDFGMARIFGGNQTEANTNRVMGTYGYMSPEYAFSGQFSEKSDVFSFGVLLLEIVSGMRNTSFHRSGLSLTLLSWAWELWKEGKEAELIDSSVKETCCSKEAVKCIHVGLLCVQEDPIDRPTMSLVVFMLSSDSQVLPSPKEPAFRTRRTDDRSPQRPKECSNNELTISFPKGR
ncbi:G-type lectin S-receptor-like serine/threonine-protein kinase At4g27290 isoform X2 [Jatropha curcas]|uniref:G-type lectin S-receptor-like serine/threonine-protein kinase At4g27290 isoform X2 n=1 Tax=Jatropha curcas TaxID=180498 RepID=UPI0009D7720E|nr:G-type lectin S-receptor-like serine/threonine-protein kinase At4g27290 isoform X2 [Jatropha curcas]